MLAVNHPLDDIPVIVEDEYDGFQTETNHGGQFLDSQLPEGGPVLTDLELQ
jgi:hypothetical protein